MLAKILRMTGVVQDPNKIDLRFFRTMTLSDTPDGYGTASDGETRHLLFYDGKFIHESITFKDHGSTEGRRSYGDTTGFYHQMFGISQRYIQILHFARRKIGVGLETVSSSLYLSEVDFEILQNHPQYINLLREFREAGWQVELVIDNDAETAFGEKKYLITVTKIEE
jgi:hypothetical protein